MSVRVPQMALWGLLLLALTISPALGLLTPYVSLLVVIPLFVATIVRGRFSAAYAAYEARAFLAVFVVLAIICAVTADSVSDGLRAFNFTMLLAYGAIAYFFDGQAGRPGAERIAQLAGLGVAVGFVEIAASSIVGSVDGRATGINIGPIVLSNGLLALGFISLGGILLRRDRWSWLYLPAPLLAIAATLLTGSRGPLLSVPFAALAAALFIWVVRFARSARAGAFGLMGIAVAAAVGIAVLLHGRAASMFSVFGTVAEGGTIADETTRQRFVLYRAGWQSFLQSPWVGHGWGNIMSSVKPFVPEADQGLLTWLPQLHNDVLNFAVGSGVIGVMCYLAIISAPLIGAWRSPRDGLRSFRLYGATVLTIVYVGGGLTDLMFGFEFHTYLFVMLSAILLHLCRERPTA